jgi:hypothetical protein
MNSKTTSFQGKLLGAFESLTIKQLITCPPKTSHATPSLKTSAAAAVAAQDSADNSTSLNLC